MLKSANNYTNHRAAQAENNAVARSNDYTNQRFSALKEQVDRNEKRANGGLLELGNEHYYEYRFRIWYGCQ